MLCAKGLLEALANTDDDVRITSQEDHDLGEVLSYIFGDSENISDKEEDYMSNQKDVLGAMIADDTELKLKIKPLYKDAIMPTRGTEDAAGLDMYSMIDTDIPTQESAKVGLGVAMAIPKGYVGLLFARSGKACKENVRPSNCVGVIDSDYRGEVAAQLYNDTAPEYEIQNIIEAGTNKSYQCVRKTAEGTKHVSKGERVAQLVLVPYITPKIVPCDDLDNTERGDGGFGSTGK